MKKEGQVSKRTANKRRANKSKKRPAPTPPANGVLVTVSPTGENGDQEVSVQPLGEVKQTELPALLGIARNMAEARLGIERG